MPTPDFDNLHPGQHVDKIAASDNFVLPSIDPPVRGLNTSLNAVIHDPMRADVASLAIRIISWREFDCRDTIRCLLS